MTYIEVYLAPRFGSWNVLKHGTGICLATGDSLVTTAYHGRKYHTERQGHHVSLGLSSYKTPIFHYGGYTGIISFNFLQKATVIIP